MSILVTRLAAATLIASALAHSARQPAPAANVILPVAAESQGTDMWCWAASGSMVMSFLKHPVQQCREANFEFGMQSCCDTPTPEDCVVGGWPQFAHYGFSVDSTMDVALTWDQIRDQIGTRRIPIAFSWHWTGGGGHMMVIRGYAQIGTQRVLYINDPWAPRQGAKNPQMLYEEYVSGSDHTHWNDFYDVVYHEVVNATK